MEGGVPGRRIPCTDHLVLMYRQKRIRTKGRCLNRSREPLLNGTVSSPLPRMSPCTSRSHAWWDLLSIIAGFIGAFLWLASTGISGQLDFITPVIMAFASPVLMVTRPQTDPAPLPDPAVPCPHPSPCASHPRPGLTIYYWVHFKHDIRWRFSFRTHHHAHRDRCRLYHHA